MYSIKDIYSGDPRLFMSVNGTYIKFVGGQPVLDQGWENHVLMSLFTEKGWAGNVLFDDGRQQLGSDFLEATRQPITAKALIDIRNAAEKALSNPAFGTISVTVTNPISVQICVAIIIEPVGQDSQLFFLTRDGLNWILQSKFPASREI
jgi:hypothetical protein